MRLVEGSCDLLIAYHHPSQPLQLDADRYEMVSLGQEMLAPYGKADAEGAADVPAARPRRASRCLTWAMRRAPTWARLVDQILKQSGTAIHLDRVYETDMAEGLKVMALEGHGVAFLPQSAVRKEIKSQAPGQRGCRPDGGLEMTMEVRAYRERPAGWRAAPSARRRRCGTFCSAKRLIACARDASNACMTPAKQHWPRADTASYSSRHHAERRTMRPTSTDRARLPGRKADSGRRLLGRAHRPRRRELPDLRHAAVRPCPT